MILSVRAKTFLRYQNQQKHSCHYQNYVICPVRLNKHFHHIKTLCLALFLSFLLSLLCLNCLFSMTGTFVGNVLHNHVFSLIRIRVRNSYLELEVCIFWLHFQTNHLNPLWTIVFFCNPRLLTPNHINNQLFLCLDEHLCSKFFRRKENLSQGFWKPERCTNGLPYRIKNLFASFLTICADNVNFKLIGELN